MVLTTPVIRALRRALPQARLTYLVEPQAAPVVAGNPHLDHVVVAPLLSGFARLRQDVQLARRLRRERFDVAVDFHGGPRSSWMALACGAPVRVGYTVAGRSWMYTKRVDRPRGHRARHSVENQWDLVDALLPGQARPTPVSDPVEMPDDPAASRRIGERLARWGFDSGHQYAVVHVGAGNEFRRWPEEAFAQVIATVASAGPNRRIILTTGPAQAERADTVRLLATAKGLPAGVVVTACDLGVAELRSLIDRAAVFVGGDSGPAHIAATTRTPMVVMYGPTTDTVWGPWRDPARPTIIVDAGPLPCRPCDQRRCEPGDFRCLGRIEPARVAAATERAIESGRLRQPV